MELAWLKEYAGQGVAVVVAMFFLWMLRLGGKAIWKFMTGEVWTEAKTHIATVNTTLATLGTNEIRQTSLMESMNGQLSEHGQILDRHGQTLDKHGQWIQEIHQVVRKPGGQQ